MMAISVVGVIRVDIVGARRLMTRTTIGAENRHTRAKTRAVVAGFFNRRTSVDSPSSADKASHVSTNVGIARDTIAVRIWPTSRRLGSSMAAADAVATISNPVREDGL